MHDVRQSDASGTDFTINDNIVLASGKSIIANEVKAGSMSVDTVQKKTAEGELHVNSAFAVAGN